LTHFDQVRLLFWGQFLPCLPTSDKLVYFQVRSFFVICHFFSFTFESTVLFSKQKEVEMKHIICGILLMTQWELSSVTIHNQIDIKPHLVDLALMVETDEAVEKNNEGQIKKLESLLRPSLSRIHKDRIEQLWSEIPY
jgi:hypothetical protein